MLGVKEFVLRVHCHLVARSIAKKTLCVSEGHVRGRHTVALVVGDGLCAWPMMVQRNGAFVKIGEEAYDEGRRETRRKFFVFVFKKLKMKKFFENFLCNRIKCCDVTNYVITFAWFCSQLIASNKVLFALVVFK